MNIQIILMGAYTMIILLSLLLSYSLFHKIVKARRSLFVTIVCCILLSIIISLCTNYIENIPFVYVISFMGGLILLNFIFKLSIMQTYLCECFVIFHMIVLKGMTIGVMSLILKKNIFNILSNYGTEMMSIIVSQLLYVFLLVIYIKIVKVKATRSILSNKYQLFLTLTCHLTLTIFMLFNTFTFYYNLDLVWMSVSQIFVSIIVYLVYMIILNYGVSTADLIQHKIRDQQQLEIIQSQLRQQNSTLKITEVLNRFKHDYRERMLIIEDHIENKRYQKALDETRNDCLEILTELPHVSKYCNNVIINSLLIDRNEICKEKGIDMDALLYYPLDLSITEKECHEVLRILTNNAIQANERIKEEARYLKIKSNIDKHWLSLLVENPYEGIILFENSLPIPSYIHASNEGLGLVYIKELLEANHGMMYIECKNQLFRVTVLIHIEGKGEGV